MDEENYIEDASTLDVQESTKKKYERFKYSEEDLQNAMESVRSKQLSLNKAALQFKIPKSTLSKKLTGKTTEERRMGPPPVLTAIEERNLEEWIIGKAKIGFPMHKDDVKDAVCKVMKETGRKNPFIDDRPGDKWVSLFMKRHPKITQRNTEIISKGKACLTEDSIREWFKDLEQYLKDENCLDILSDGDRIFNADDTGVECCPKTGKVMGPKNYKDFYNIAPGKEKESITVLANFSASGKKVPPMIVFPYKRIPRDVCESVPPTYFIGRSDSGWMVAPTFYEYVANCFFPWLQENGIQLPILLLLDGHKSHINLELSKFCSEKQIIVYGLLPNATNILQPCDLGVFRPLKAAWKVAVRQWKLTNGNAKTLSKTNFTPIFQKAFEESINANKIQNAFKKSGIFPFNVNQVDFNKCMQNRHKELRHAAKGNEPNSLDKTSERLFFCKLESEIPEELLASFKLADNAETNNHFIKEPVLFSIWKKYRHLSLGHENMTRPIQPQLETNNEIKSYDAHSSNNVLEIDLDVASNDVTTISYDNLPNMDSEIESTNKSEVFPDGILKDIGLPTTSNNVNKSISSTSKLDTTLNISVNVKSRTPEDIWKEHLSWPEISQSQSAHPRKTIKRKMPFAITSKKYQDILEAEKMEKETKESIQKMKKE